MARKSAETVRLRNVSRPGNYLKFLCLLYWIVCICTDMCPTAATDISPRSLGITWKIFSLSLGVYLKGTNLCREKVRMTCSN